MKNILHYRVCGVMGARDIWGVEAPFKSDIFDHIIKKRKENKKMKLVTTRADLREYGKKYHFYQNAESDIIVCTTVYKGKMVRGIAKCSPEDSFDLELGKKLAYLRCKKKFARKKLKHARNAYKDAFLAEAKARNNLSKAAEFVNDSDYLLELVTNELIDFERKLEVNN